MNTKERTPVPVLGDGWFLLQDDEVLQDGDKVSAAGIDVDGNTWPETVCAGLTVRTWRRNNPDYFCARYFGPAEEPEPITKPIDWTKPVRTKLTKWPVTLVTVKGRGNYPIIGYVGDNTDLSQWNLQGNKPGRGEDPDGLENAPQRIQREYWVNVYERYDCQYPTREKADEGAGTARIACVKITIDCEEGEGL